MIIHIGIGRWHAGHRCIVAAERPGLVGGRCAAVCNIAVLSGV